MNIHSRMKEAVQNERGRRWSSYEHNHKTTLWSMLLSPKPFSKKMLIHCYHHTCLYQYYIPASESLFMAVTCRTMLLFTKDLKRSGSSAKTWKEGSEKPAAMSFFCCPVHLWPADRWEAFTDSLALQMYDISKSQNGTMRTREISSVFQLFFGKNIFKEKYVPDFHQKKTAGRDSNLHWKAHDKKFGQIPGRPEAPQCAPKVNLSKSQRTVKNTSRGSCHVLLHYKAYQMLHKSLPDVHHIAMISDTGCLCRIHEYLSSTLTLDILL